MKLILWSLFSRFKILFNKECKKLTCTCWLISTDSTWTIILTCSNVFSSWVVWFSLRENFFVESSFCYFNQSFPFVFKTNQKPAALIIKFKVEILCFYFMRLHFAIRRLKFCMGNIITNKKIFFPNGYNSMKKLQLNSTHSS